MNSILEPKKNADAQFAEKRTPNTQLKIKKKKFHNPNQIEPQIKWFVWKEGEQEKLKKENIARVSCQVGGAPESQSLLTWKLALEFSSLVHHCSLAFHMFFLKNYGMECYVLFTPLFGLPLSIWFDFIVMHLDLYTYILSHLIKKEKCKASMTPTKQEEEWKKKKRKLQRKL